MKHVKKLPQEVCSLMRSAVIIPTPSQAVVELVFNSIDANASCIAVRVDLHLFKIQVIDNGHGISLSDLEFIGNRSITSKCYSLDEFYNNLKYHGYRGEALASLREMCGLLEVVSFPLEGNNTYKKLFVHGKEEKVKECQVKRPSHGTTVTITDFMFNMPVRRQKMKAAIELEAIRSSIEYIALAHPEISISIRDDTKEKLILEKHRSSSLLSAFEHLFGSKIASTLAPVNFSSEKFKISGYISKEAHRHNDLQFIYVNRQPIMKTKLHKLVTSLLCMSAIIRTNGPWKNRPIRKDIPTERWLSFPFLGKQNKFSVFVINVECARKEYEICWNSKKPLIYFNDWEDVLECISNAIKGFLMQENLVVEEEGEQELDEKEIEEIKVNSSPNKSKFSSGDDASKDRLQINEIITQSFETNADPVVVSVERRNESLETFCEVETTAPTNEKNDKMDYCCVQEKYVPHSLQVKCVKKDVICVGKSSEVVDVSKNEEIKKTFKNSYKFSNFKCPSKSKLISVKRNQNCETNKTAGYRSAVSRKIKGLLSSKQNIEKEKKIFFMNNGGCINKNSRSSQNIEFPVFTHNSSESRAGASNSQCKNDADMSILSLSENAELSKSCSSNYASNQRINEILIFDDSKVAKAEVSSTKNCEISQKNIMLRNRGPLGEDFHESVESMTNIPKLLCSENVSKKLRITNVNDNQLYALSSEFQKQSHEEGLSSSSELTIIFPNNSKNVQSSVAMLSDGECKPLIYNSVLRNTLNSPNCISTYERYCKEEQVTDKLNFFSPGESTEQSKELVMERSSESDSFSSSDDRIVYFRNVFKCFVESRSSEKVSELKSPYFTTPSNVQASTGDKKLHNHKNERIIDFTLHGRIFQEEYSLLSTPTVNEDELEFPKRRKISEREIVCVNKDETSQKSEQSQKILFPDKVVDSNELMVCDLVSKQLPYNLEMPPNPSEVLNSFMNCDSENSRSSKWREKDNISSEEKLNISDVLRPIQLLPDFSLISAKMCGLLFQQKFDKRIFQNLQIVNQLDNKFIVTLCSLENLKPHILAVFDQHAVHERIRLEALMKEYSLCPEDYTFKSTVLCEPLVLTVTSKEVHVLSSFQHKFEKLGLFFTLEEKSEISVFRVPTCMYTRFLRERSRQWLEESLHILIQDVVLFLINTGGQDSLVPEIFKSVINSEACKGAIKFGDTLTIEQCKELLFKLSECDLPFFCAHGRPSFMPLFDLNQFEEERKKCR